MENSSTPNQNSQTSGWERLKSLFKAPTKEAEAVSMPIGRLMFEPFGIFADKLKVFLRLGGIFALASLALALIFGLSAACSLEAGQQVLYCANTDSLVLYFYIPLKILLLAMFCVAWYQEVFAEQRISLRKLLCPKRQDFGFFGFLLAFLVLNAVPLLSFYLLIVRIPNPDWRVEAAYFTLVGIGFLVPFWLMRFYALAAFVLAQEPLCPFILLWQKTRGNMLKILLSVFLLFLLLTMILVNYGAGMARLIQSNELLPTFISEYIYSFVFLIVAALVINHCALQKELLFEKEPANDD